MATHELESVVFIIIVIITIIITHCQYVASYLEAMAFE